jgi:hypothetical protein
MAERKRGLVGLLGDTGLQRAVPSMAVAARSEAASVRPRPG